VRTDSIVALEATLNDVASVLAGLGVTGYAEGLEQRPRLERDLEADGTVAALSLLVERGPTGREHGLAAETELPVGIVGVGGDVRGPGLGIVEVQRLQDVPQRPVVFSLGQRSFRRLEERHQRRAGRVLLAHREVLEDPIPQRQQCVGVAQRRHCRVERVAVLH